MRRRSNEAVLVLLRREELQSKDQPQDSMPSEYDDKFPRPENKYLTCLPMGNLKGSCSNAARE